MKISKYFKIAFFIFMVSSTMLYGKDKIHNVLILKDWKPYYSIDKNGKPSGYAIDLFEEIAKEIGLKYQYKIFDNWSQMAKYRKSGKEYIVPNTGIAKMRASYTLYSDPTDTFQINYFKRKDSFNLRNTSDLSNKHIGIVENNICLKLIESTKNKILFQDHFMAISSLLSGDTDALCYPKPLLDATLKSLHLEDKIVPFGKPLHEIKRAFGVSLNNQYLIPKINKSISILKENGSYKKIYSKWFIKDNEIVLTYDQIILYISIGVLTLILIIFLIYYISIKRKWILTYQQLNKKIDEKTQKLELSLDLYNKALSVSEDGIWDWEISSSKVYYSPVWKSMLGYSIDEIKNDFSEWERLVHPDDLKKAQKEALKLANGEIEKYAIEFRMICKDGSIKWILSRAKMVEKDKNNKPKRIVGVHIDLTTQKEKEKQILQEKEKFESIFNNSKDGIAIFDLESRFLEFNDAYLEMLGYSAQELTQKTCIDLSVPEYKEKSKKALENILKDGYIENFEKKCLTKDGREIFINMSAKLLADKERIIAISKNISSLKVLEREEKLVAMGEMIGNIAHQWRQPLSVITMNVNNIKLDCELGELNPKDLQEPLNIINQNAQYLSKTIDDFRNFIKGDDSYSKISLNETIKESLALTEATRKQNFINLITNIEEELYLFGNKNELVQAFINILNNSKDILKEQTNIENKYILINAKKLNSKIELEFLDNAGGISHDIIKRIFEPYFTTKHKSAGTGLGLTMVEKIIRERHKGKIGVSNKEFIYENKNYTGACFVIEFASI